MAGNIVIVGGGQAGAAAAAKLRGLGHEGGVTILGAEPHIPYQRPPLSKKYLLGEMALDRLHLRPASFYADNRIELLTGEPATAIDRQARELATTRRRLPWDRLILATGARPRRLPAEIGGDLAGVWTVRDLQDVDGFAPDFTVGRRALIVGGGYIGLEAAAVAAQRGLAVTLVEMAPRILGRVASAETAAYFRDLHRGHGVDLREGTGLVRLIGEGGRVRAAELSDGTTLEVDFAIAGIGVEPETGLARAAGLAIDNGIAVDGGCRTSDPAILAAGDCASFPWRGRRVRLESVQNAIDQAEHAAAVIMGAEGDYMPVPWFWSDQYDVKLQIAGLNLDAERTVARPGTRAGQLSVWYYRGAELLAVDAMNDPRAFMQGKRWIEAGVSPDPLAVGDATRDLRQLA